MEDTPGVRGRSRPTDQVQTDGPAGPQDQPEFLSANWSQRTGAAPMSGNDPPATRTMNAAATAP